LLGLPGWAIVSAMQLSRLKAVSLIGLIGLSGLFAAPAHPAEDNGVILDLDALKSLKREQSGQDVKQTIYTVTYEPGAAKPASEAQTEIGRVAAAARNSMARLSIVAYAPMAAGENENDARRLALRRAIALRQILIAAGVDGSRVNLQPMGVHPDGGEKSDQAQIIVRQP
jgi:hypothetical protein